MDSLSRNAIFFYSEVSFSSKNIFVSNLLSSLLQISRSRRIGVNKRLSHKSNMHLIIFITLVFLFVEKTFELVNSWTEINDGSN